MKFSVIRVPLLGFRLQDGSFQKILHFGNSNLAKSHLPLGEGLDVARLPDDFCSWFLNLNFSVPKRVFKAWPFLTDLFPVL